MNINTNKISSFLQEENKHIVFNYLSPKFLIKNNLEFLIDVPIPFGENEHDISTLDISFNMARILGADPNFPYLKQYQIYFEKIFGNNALKAFMSFGTKMADEKKCAVAMMIFRCILLLDEENKNGMYLYARICMDIYNLESQKADLGDEELIGSLKAEALKYFEKLTMIYKEFSKPYYFLGYLYLNLGLYNKAKLTWEEFLKLNYEGENVRPQNEEIIERLKSLKEPVNIENAINFILRGDYEQGLSILNKYTESEFSSWWPIWFYLGEAKMGQGEFKEASDYYIKALKYSPSNIDIMEKLVMIFQNTGDREKEKKYQNKINIINENLNRE